MSDIAVETAMIADFACYFYVLLIPCWCVSVVSGREMLKY